MQFQLHHRRPQNRWSWKRRKAEKAFLAPTGPLAIKVWRDDLCIPWDKVTQKGVWKFGPAAQMVTSGVQTAFPQESRMRVFVTHHLECLPLHSG